jgi:hypothetical protein
MAPHVDASLVRSPLSLACAGQVLQEKIKKLERENAALLADLEKSKAALKTSEAAQNEYNEQAKNAMFRTTEVRTTHPSIGPIHRAPLSRSHHLVHPHISHDLCTPTSLTHGAHPPRSQVSLSVSSHVLLSFIYLVPTPVSHFLYSHRR